MFLFLAYHVVYIYCAVKGKRGFAFYNLPVFRWSPDGRRIPFINHIIIHSCEDKENSKTVYLVFSASSFWSHVYIGKDLLKQNWMQHDTFKKKKLKNSCAFHPHFKTPLPANNTTDQFDIIFRPLSCGGGSLFRGDKSLKRLQSTTAIFIQQPSFKTKHTMQQCN